MGSRSGWTAVSDFAPRAVKPTVLVRAFGADPAPSPEFRCLVPAAATWTMDRSWYWEPLCTVWMYSRHPLPSAPQDHPPDQATGRRSGAAGTVSTATWIVDAIRTNATAMKLGSAVKDGQAGTGRFRCGRDRAQAISTRSVTARCQASVKAGRTFASTGGQPEIRPSKPS